MSRARPRLLTQLAVVACLASPGLLLAARSSTRLTPGSTRDQSWAFTVKAERVRSTTGSEVLEVTVTAVPVDPKSPRLPDRTATLEVADGAAFVSSAPVEAKRAGANTSYTFRVAERYATKSRFVFGETDAGSKFANGAYYWFYLADFVPPRAAPRGTDPAVPLPEKTPSGK